ncbi:MAG: anthranilate phosphoribosyltransferase [Clostridium sp.]
MDVKGIIKKLILGEGLSEYEAYEITNSIVSGEVSSCQIGAYLTLLSKKGEEVNEIIGTVKALREKMMKIELNDYLIDTCGTGGDGGKTFNVSSAVAIVASSGGVKVAKHGNRAISSKSGSADVYRELGIKVDFSKEEAEKEMNNKGMAFLFAPFYHPALKTVAQERADLGIRTIFNLVGPLVNPANLSGQIMGVFHKDLVNKIGEVQKGLGLKKGLIVHGEDGLDEISICSKTFIYEIKDGEGRSYEIKPEDFGIRRASLKEIEGGESSENAKIILDILNGKQGPCRDVVVLNSGAALYVGNKVDSIKEGVELAGKLIDSGAALNKLMELRSESL